ITIACEYCRFKKLKCDNGDPCKQCIKYHKECKRTKPSKKRGPKPNSKLKPNYLSITSILN
ncbi:hypothetical protein C2G38_1984482, partial [Gigaspora rosea]